MLCILWFFFLDGGFDFEEVFDGCGCMLFVFLGEMEWMGIFGGGLGLFFGDWILKLWLGGVDDCIFLVIERGFVDKELNWWDCVLVVFVRVGGLLR